MVAKKKATTGTRGVKKLKLRKETIRDLDVKGKAREVKGGITATCQVCCTEDKRR